MKKIDIIVPCYNEQDVITSFYNETSKITDTIDGYYFNFIFINDGSKDDTLLLLKGLAATYDNVKFISFSRNFGKEAALYAGFSASKGDYAIVMDADLQHPPSLIPRMIESVENGHDCCAAKRTSRKGERKVISFFSQMFYRFNNRLTDSNIPYGAVDYRIMSRQMVETIVSLGEVQRFSRGLFSWIGFDKEWIEYDNVERTIGTSKWSFKSLTRYAMDGIFSFSIKPLRFVAVMGFIISAIAMIYGLYILIKTLVTGIDFPGYASTMVVMLFLGGIIELSIGIVGEYVARIFTESKKRPIYITKETNIKALTEEDSHEESDS